MNSLFIFAVLFGVVTIYGHPGPEKYEIGSHNYEMSAMRQIELENSGSNEPLKYIDIHKVPETDPSELPEGVQAAIIKNERGLWPNKLVWYSFDSEFSSDEARQEVRDAVKGISDVTCIKFREYNPATDAKPKHYVRIFSGSGCWSYIGYATFNGKGNQDMSLRDPGCVNKKIIQHEFIHALGAYHEQSRNDRDKYINLFKENMVDGAWGQFQKQTLSTIDSRGVAYDGESIMHYSRYAFSKNGNPTMQWKGNPSKRLGGTKLSESDIKQLNLLYSCKLEPSTTTTTAPKTTTTTPKTTTTTPKTTTTTPKTTTTTPKTTTTTPKTTTTTPKTTTTTPKTTTTTPKTTTTAPKTTTTTPKTTTTTTKTTTTRTTTTQRPGECKDKKSFCSSIGNIVAWCRYKGVQVSCPKTCGLCDKTTTTTTTKAPSGNGCIDVSRHCSERYRNCSSGIYQRRCRKACNQCDKPLPPKCKGLSDSSPKCPVVVRSSNGACNVYRNHCQLSCCLRDRN
ncbi:zinc metalloproteinase nas-14-like [Clytia hemisphaerica]|uniref:Metalloendopeptidase n=1 Tax=Clytia hemisphaerica TaxID=252671 RepID=A0A7M5X485_9CNID